MRWIVFKVRDKNLIAVFYKIGLKNVPTWDNYSKIYIENNFISYHQMPQLVA